MSLVSDLAKSAGYKLASKQEKDIFRGLGIDVDGSMSTDKILNEIGLDWHFAKSDTQYGHMFQYQSGKRPVLYRIEDGMFMDVVSKDWDAPSFSETVNLFREFASANQIDLEKIGTIQSVEQDKYGEEQLKLTLFAAGSLGSNTTMQLPGSDRVDGKVILRMPYNYEMGLSVGLMAERLVCTNGMTAKVSDNLIISHKNLDVQKVRRTMEQAVAKWEKTQSEFQLLADTEMSMAIAVTQLVKQFGDPTKTLADQNKVVQSLIEQFESGHYMGGEMLSAYSTCWGLLNVATEYLNHNYGRAKEAVKLVDRVIDPTSAVNVKQAEFLNSISAFAYAERNRQASTQTVAVRAW
jgi:hypothetical protein